MSKFTHESDDDAAWEDVAEDSERGQLTPGDGAAVALRLATRFAAERRARVEDSSVAEQSEGLSSHDGDYRLAGVKETSSKYMRSLKGLKVKVQWVESGGEETEPDEEQGRASTSEPRVRKVKAFPPKESWDYSRISLWKKELFESAAKMSSQRGVGVCLFYCSSGTKRVEVYASRGLRRSVSPRRLLSCVVPVCEAMQRSRVSKREQEIRQGRIEALGRALLDELEEDDRVRAMQKASRARPGEGLGPRDKASRGRRRAGDRQEASETGWGRQDSAR